MRDRASGIVTGVVNLSPTLDYDIDYLQGSVLLAEPLSSTVDDNLLIRSGALSGDEAYLVVRYEYAPGFDEIDARLLPAPRGMYGSPTSSEGGLHRQCQRRRRHRQHSGWCRSDATERAPTPG